MTTGCQNGLGKPLTNVSPDELRWFAIVTYARTVAYPWALGFAKISILIFYRRVFPVDKFRRICECFMLFIGGLAIGTSFASAFGCKPLSNGPHLIYNTPGDGCINRLELQLVANIMHLITDVVIWLLPMPYLWHLRLKKQKRIRTIIIFSVGIIPCCASALRIKALIDFYEGSDPTRQAVGIAILSATEVNLVIIAASIPASNAFYARYFIQPVKRRLQRIWPSISMTTAATGIHNQQQYKGYGNYTFCQSGTGAVPDSRFSGVDTTLCGSMMGHNTMRKSPKSPLPSPSPSPSPASAAKFSGSGFSSSTNSDLRGLPVVARRPSEFNKYSMKGMTEPTDVLMMELAELESEDEDRVVEEEEEEEESISVEGQEQKHEGSAV